MGNSLGNRAFGHTSMSNVTGWEEDGHVIALLLVCEVDACCGEGIVRALVVTCLVAVLSPMDFICRAVGCLVVRLPVYLMRRCFMQTVNPLIRPSSKHHELFSTNLALSSTFSKSTS